MGCIAEWIMAAIAPATNPVHEVRYFHVVTFSRLRFLQLNVQIWSVLEMKNTNAMCFPSALPVTYI